MTERQQRAQELHGKGYNCAQSVACAYCDLVGLDEQTAYKMAEGFGLGMGVMDMCGALSGAFMLAGVKGSAGIEAPGTTKAQTYQQTREMANAISRRRTAPTSAASSRVSPTAMSAAPAPAASRMRARWSRRCSTGKKQNR